MPVTRGCDRAAVQARLLERIEAGWADAALAREPGFPSLPTIRAWARADPAFANRLRWARNWRRGLKVERRVLSAARFDPAWGEALVEQVRRGVKVGSLIGGRGQPSRAQVRAWRREAPTFDAALAAAVRRWRGVHPAVRRRDYDEAVADRIVLRLSKGATIEAIYADPELPGRQIVSRWRRQEPAFDAAVRMAIRAGWPAKLAPNSRRNDTEMIEAVCLHVLHGGSLRSAARTVPGAPCLTTLYAWMRRDPEFARSIEVAREMRGETMADRALAAALEALPDGDASALSRSRARRRPR